MLSYNIDETTMLQEIIEKSGENSIISKSRGGNQF
jgi:hypothetical protein